MRDGGWVGRSAGTHSYMCMCVFAFLCMRVCVYVYMRVCMCENKS